MPLRRNTLLRTEQLLAARRADVVILQRKLLPGWQVRLLRRAAAKLVFDLDDAVFQRDSFSGKSPQSRRRMARFEATVRAADAVIAGNEHLGSRAAACTDPGRVHVVPTCVEPKCYPLARHERTGSQVRLVWIGTANTLKGLALAREHLAAIGRRLPGLELRLICDRAIEVPGLRVQLRPWSAATEAAELAACDVAITWLPDDGFSRGKCGLKVLQYAAAGLPVVANPVGMNPRMVLHGRAGLLATTPDDWAEAIAQLAADPPLRQSMGTAGRRMVEEQYSVARWEHRFAAIIDGVRHNAHGSTPADRSSRGANPPAGAAGTAVSGPHGAGVTSPAKRPNVTV